MFLEKGFQLLPLIKTGRGAARDLIQLSQKKKKAPGIDSRSLRCHSVDMLKSREASLTLLRFRRKNLL
jgi:hypothetical protein